MPTVSRWIKSESVLHNDPDIYNSVKHSISLKPRIEVITDRMNFHVARLNGILRDLKKEDDGTFRKIVSSVKRNDARYSAILASDLMGIRKVYKIIALSILVFETLESKLKNAVDFGELVVILSPSVAIVKNLRSSLVQHVPEYKEGLNKSRY
jgi:division protein CdvB (Snf7/Vps24/ESCRT-III family)